MTDIHGGRVLAGEDSEEDDDDDGAYSFQFGGFGSQGGTSASAPRFSVPTVVVAPQAGGEGSDEEEEEEEEEKTEAAADVRDEAAPAAPKPVSESNDDKDSEAGDATNVGEQSSDATGAEREAMASADAPKSSVSSIGNSIKGKDLAATPVSSAKDKQVERKPLLEDDVELWPVDLAMDGVQMMGSAFVSSIQPSLDASIQRIEELRSNQKHLLQLLVDQNASVANNKQIEDVAVVLDKLPHYFTKVQMIRAAMAEISASVDKMKRRAENLRIDAQSHALKKENKRDAQSQWNKLYAAKSAALPSASGES